MSIYIYKQSVYSVHKVYKIQSNFAMGHVWCNLLFLRTADIINPDENSANNIDIVGLDRIS